MLSCSRPTATILAVLTAVGNLILAAPSRAQPTEGGDAAATAPRALGACNRTTDFLSDACDRDAQAELQLALGICANTGSPAKQQACARRARRAFGDNNRGCEAQERARAGVCRALGQAAYDPPIRPANFTHVITNPYLPWRPGTVWTYRGPDLVITVEVLRRTIRILGVTCVVVRDRVVVDGELQEDTFDYYAQDLAGNVWYFGEDTAEFRDGAPVRQLGHLARPASTAPSPASSCGPSRARDTYRQEFALDEAEDIARVASLGERAPCPSAPSTMFSRPGDQPARTQPAREQVLRPRHWQRAHGRPGDRRAGGAGQRSPRPLSLASTARRISPAGRAIARTSGLDTHFRPMAAFGLLKLGEDSRWCPRRRIRAEGTPRAPRRLHRGDLQVSLRPGPSRMAG